MTLLAGLAAVGGCGGDAGPTALLSGPAPVSGVTTTATATPAATATAAPEPTAGTAKSPVLWLDGAATGPAARCSSPPAATGPPSSGWPSGRTRMTPR